MEKNKRSFSSSSISSALRKASKIPRSVPIINNEYTSVYNCPNALPNTPVVKQYSDSAFSYKDIVNDFRNKSVIYMWFNKVKKEVYIGSAVDAQQRLRRYYSLSNLVNQKNSRICRSILKYGHNNYSFFILQVCGERGTVPSQILLQREKFYLDWALKTYHLGVLNIRPVRGSGQNFRLSNETIFKLIGKKHKDDTRLILRLAKLKENNHNFNKLNVVSTRINIEVIHKETNRITMYSSLSKAAKDLKTTSKTLKSYIKDKTLFRGEYEIKAGNPQSIALRVKVTNLETNTIDVYDSIRRASIGLNISVSAIHRYLSNNTLKPLKGKYKITLL